MGETTATRDFGHDHPGGRRRRKSFIDVQPTCDVDVSLEWRVTRLLLLTCAAADVVPQRPDDLVGEKVAKDLQVAERRAEDEAGSCYCDLTSMR